MEQHNRNYPYGLTIAAFAAAAVFTWYQYRTDLLSLDWMFLALLALLLSYFQLRSISFGGRFSYSLTMVVFSPAVYLWGAAAGLVLAACGGLLDLAFHKKSWERVVFNMAQLGLAAVASASAFQWAGGTIGQLTLPGSLAPMLVGSAVYFAVNFGSVTFLRTVFAHESWWDTLKQLSIDAGLNFLIVGYIGAVCTLFIYAWGLWGLVLFGFMVAGIAELLQMGLKANLEKNLRQEAEAAMLVDSKTGAFNFRYMNEWLMSNAGEGPTKETVLFLDLDDFKAFNDRFGHQLGDDALVRVADSIRATIRDSHDALVRYGGEEFVVLLPGLSKEDGILVAERIREQLSNIKHGAACAALTVSIGLASRPFDSDSRPDLVRKADLAMYQAKAQGKDRHCPWEPEWEANTELLQQRAKRRGGLLKEQLGEP